MTKAELIAALADVTDDAEILITCCATSNSFDEMIAQAAADFEFDNRVAELSEITCVEKHEGEPDFVVLMHHMEYTNR